MRNVVIAFLISLFFCSCSKDYLFNRDQKTISNDLKEIQVLDQTVRNFESYTSLKYKVRDFIFIHDSLIKSGARGNLNEVFDFSKLPTVKEQVLQLPKDTQDEYFRDVTGEKKLRTYIDSINRIRIYKIIKKYGYPSFYNRKWSDTINTRTGITYVLTHTNPENAMGKRTLDLMVKEYKKGRVEDGEMRHYLWHVSGRKFGDSLRFNLDINKWIKENN